ncbi:MAG: hypothetical protein B7X11_02070, partial [Acidobacteria bacterium 37-65-4]
MSRLSPLPLRLLLLGVLVVVAPACGKRGPPLPPLRPAPGRVTELTFVRRDQDVVVTFATPTTNIDGSEPVLFDRVEIYALTAAAGALPPTVQKVFVPKNRVAVLGKRPDGVAAAPAAVPDADAVPVAMPLAFSEKVPIVPLPIVITPLPIVYTLVPELLSAPPAPSTTTVATGAPVTGAGIGLPSATRFYLIVPYANRTRVGAMSDMVGVPLGPVPVAPHDAVITYDEQTLTLSWVTDVTGQSCHVYDAGPDALGTAKPLTLAPLTVPEYKRPVVFGTRVCLAARAVSGA